MEDTLNSESQSISAWLKPGDRIPFGCSVWRVLEVDAEANTALVIADAALCRRAFHYTDAVVTWEDCSLRAWLNGEYLETSFSEEEKAAIMECEIHTSGYSHRHTPGGCCDTTDRIFLLSMEEAGKYSQWLRNITSFSENRWLRTPARINKHAAFTFDAYIRYRGYLVDDESVSVCPAFKLNLDAEVFRSIASEGEKSVRKLKVLATPIREIGLTTLYEESADSVCYIGDLLHMKPEKLLRIGSPSQMDIFQKTVNACRALYDVEIEDLGLSERVMYLLRKNGVRYALEVVDGGGNLPGVGRKSVLEIQKHIEEYVKNYYRTLYGNVCLEQVGIPSRICSVLQKNHIIYARDAIDGCFICIGIGKNSGIEILHRLYEYADSHPIKTAQQPEEKALSTTELDIPDRTASELMPDLAVGMRITRGNGKTVWRILGIDADTDTMLLLADTPLGEGPFHTERVPVTWETCALRKRLNGEAAKQTSAEDKAFLLSLEEVQCYLPTEADRASENGGWWWLRSSVLDDTRAMIVDGSGYIYEGGAAVDMIGGIRPAVRVPLNITGVQVIGSR